MTNTYWNGDRNPDEVKYLNDQLPAEGAIEGNDKRPWLEAWRQFSNGYYDLFNNGWANWSDMGPEFLFACCKGGYNFNKADFIRLDGAFTNNIEPQWWQLELVGDTILNRAIFECALLGAYRAKGKADSLDWAEAPEGFNYAAMDQDGQWWWHEEKPVTFHDSVKWFSTGVMMRLVADFVPAWKTSLCKRPLGPSCLRWSECCNLCKNSHDTGKLEDYCKLHRQRIICTQVCDSFERRAE